MIQEENTHSLFSQIHSVDDIYNLQQLDSPVISGTYKPRDSSEKPVLRNRSKSKNNKPTEKNKPAQEKKQTNENLPNKEPTPGNKNKNEILTNLLKGKANNTQEKIPEAETVKPISQKANPTTQNKNDSPDRTKISKSKSSNEKKNRQSFRKENQHYSHSYDNKLEYRSRGKSKIRSDKRDLKEYSKSRSRSRSRTRGRNEDSNPKRNYDCSKSKSKSRYVKPSNRSHSSNKFIQFDNHKKYSKFDNRSQSVVPHYKIRTSQDKVKNYNRFSQNSFNNSQVNRKNPSFSPDKTMSNLKKFMDDKTIKMTLEFQNYLRANINFSESFNYKDFEYFKEIALKTSHETLVNNLLFNVFSNENLQKSVNLMNFFYQNQMKDSQNCKNPNLSPQQSKIQPAFNQKFKRERSNTPQFNEFRYKTEHTRNFKTNLSPRLGKNIIDLNSLESNPSSQISSPSNNTFLQKKRCGDPNEKENNYKKKSEDLTYPLLKNNVNFKKQLDELIRNDEKYNEIMKLTKDLKNKQNLSELKSLISPESSKLLESALSNKKSDVFNKEKTKVSLYENKYIILELIIDNKTKQWETRQKTKL